MDHVPHHPHRNAVPIPYPGPPNPAPNPGMTRFAAFLQRMHLAGNRRPRVPAALWNLGPRFPPPAAWIYGRKKA